MSKQEKAFTKQEFFNFIEEQKAILHTLKENGNFKILR